MNRIEVQLSAGKEESPRVFTQDSGAQDTTCPIQGQNKKPTDIWKSAEPGIKLL